MFGIGFQEMLIILVVILIFFGPKRLPDLAKSLGKGIAEFKKASEEVKKGIDDAMKEEMTKEEPPPAPMPEPAKPIEEPAKQNPEAAKPMPGTARKEEAPLQPALPYADAPKPSGESRGPTTPESRG